MRVSNQVVADHQAAAVASEECAAPFSRAAGNHDTMNSHFFGRGQCQRKGVLAPWVEEDPVGMIANPALGAVDLSCGVPDRSLEPTSPVRDVVAGVRIGTGFVRENDHVPVEGDQDVAQLLSAALVAVEVGIAPWTEKCPFAQANEVLFGRCDAGGLLHLYHPRRFRRARIGWFRRYADWMYCFGLPTTNGYEFVARDGAGNDNCQCGCLQPWRADAPPVRDGFRSLCCQSARPCGQSFAGLP